MWKPVIDKALVRGDPLELIEFVSATSELEHNLHVYANI
jgi:hypothetical protein